MRNSCGFQSQISYAVAESLSSRYHAHASGTLLVLLDATPSQEMVDEGVAREVINKIQKLRKKVFFTLVFIFHCHWIFLKFPKSSFFVLLSRRGCNHEMPLRSCTKWAEKGVEPR